MSPHMSPPPPPAARKGPPVWVWILAAIGGVIALGLIAVVVAGMFVAQKINEFASNPRELARIVTEANPNLEFQDFDKNSKTIRVKDKASGEVMTIKWDDLKEGRVSISKRSDKGEQSIQLGQGGKANLPHFVPKYPGVEITSVMSAQGGSEGSGGMATFTTKDSSEQVTAFFESEFKKSGMTLAMQTKSSEGSMITAKSADEKESVVVTLSKGDEGTQVSLLYGSKKD